jgi:hypothetical protein
MTWGTVGVGNRIHPLAFSRELLPVGSHIDNGVERPRAVSEYLVERMMRAGATKICFAPTSGTLVNGWLARGDEACRHPSRLARCRAPARDAGDQPLT